MELSKNQKELLTKACSLHLDRRCRLPAECGPGTNYRLNTGEALKNRGLVTLKLPSVGCDFWYVIPTKEGLEWYNGQT